MSDTAEKRRKNLALEVGWLIKILGVSGLQKLRNKEIRSALNQEEMLCKRIQQRRLTWFGHIERMEDNRIPQYVTLLHYRQQKQRKINKNMDG